MPNIVTTGGHDGGGEWEPHRTNQGSGALDLRTILFDRKLLEYWVSAPLYNEGLPEDSRDNEYLRRIAIGDTIKQDFDKLKPDQFTVRRFWQDVASIRKYASHKTVLGPEVWWVSNGIVLGIHRRSADRSVDEAVAIPNPDSASEGPNLPLMQVLIRDRETGLNIDQNKELPLTGAFLFSKMIRAYPNVLRLR
jgi:hypothetical protein